MHVQRDVLGIYNNGHVLRGEVSPKKADYVRCSFCKLIFFTLKHVKILTRNGQKTHHSSARKGTGDASMQPSEVLTGSSQGVRATAKSQSTTTRESKPRKKRDSRTLWERMPDDHPWKQEAIPEVASQVGSRQTNEPEIRPNPSSQQADYNWDEGEGKLKI